MAKFVEVRVRPVTRYVVTRYESAHPDGCSYSGSEPLGEFDNERAAERVAAALRDAEGPQGNNGWIVVRAHDYTVETAAYYANDREEAEATKARVEAETGAEWRIYRRGWR